MRRPRNVGLVVAFDLTRWMLLAMWVTMRLLLVAIWFLCIGWWWRLMFVRRVVHYRN